MGMSRKYPTWALQGDPPAMVEGPGGATSAGETPAGGEPTGRDAEETSGEVAEGDAILLFLFPSQVVGIETATKSFVSSIINCDNNLLLGCLFPYNL